MTGIVDAHNDLLLELAFRGLQHGQRNPFAGYWLEPLRQGNVVLQVCPVSSELGHMPEGTLRQALGEVAAFHRAVHDNPDTVQEVRTRRDLDSLAGSGRVGLLLSIEGAEPLGYDPWMAEIFWELGVRMIGLTWNRRNPFADGAAESPGAGLSRLGGDLVDRCAELGMVLDVAHASERTFWDILERTKPGTVVCSHSACRALLDHPRNISDEQMRALAEHGGVLGMMQHPIVFAEEQRTIDGVVDHVDHAVEVMGIEHVGLGADFCRQVVQATGWLAPPDALLPGGMSVDAAIEGLAGPEDYQGLVDALVRRGYEGERLERLLSGNLLALLRRALPES